MAIHTFAAIYIGTYDVSLKVFEFTNRKKFHEVDHIRSRQELGKGAYGTGTIGYEQVEELCETLAQFKKIMELFGYANPYRMLNLCQQIADIQGETLTVNVPFPEIFYYKM